MNKFVAAIFSPVILWFLVGAIRFGYAATPLPAQENIDALYKDKDAVTNHFDRGTALLDRNMGNDLHYAKKEFQTVIEMENQLGAAQKGLKPAAYLNLGVINAMEDNAELAAKNYLTAIQIKPIYTEAYFNLGGLYYKQKLLKKAEDAFLKAIEIEPEYGRAHYALGFVYLDQKKFDLARKQAEKAADLGVPYKTLRERLAKAKQ